MPGRRELPKYLREFLTCKESSFSGLVTAKCVKTQGWRNLANGMHLHGATMLTEANMQTELEDWRALSEAASQEQDPEKLMDLIERLNRALLHREVEISRRLAVN